MENHYEKARELLRGNPDLGKRNLAQALGVKASVAGCYKERFLGETQGHRTDPLYLQFQQLKSANPDWDCLRLREKMGVKIEIARVLEARYYGAISRSTAGPATPASDSTATARGSELEDEISGETRNLSCRSERITTLEDFLVFAQVDTRIWEVERHVINK